MFENSDLISIFRYVTNTKFVFNTGETTVASASALPTVVGDFAAGEVGSRFICDGVGKDLRGYGDGFIDRNTVAYSLPQDSNGNLGTGR